MSGAVRVLNVLADAATFADPTAVLTHPGTDRAWLWLRSHLDLAPPPERFRGPPS